jgi:hypothetical protein
MLHLSTGIAIRNGIHAAPERGSPVNVTSWNGDANEDIRDRHSLDPRGCRCRRCGRSSGSPAAAAADHGDAVADGRQDADRQGADRQMAGRQGACRLCAATPAASAGAADRYPGLNHPKNGSTVLVRSFFAPAGTPMSGAAPTRMRLAVKYTPCRPHASDHRIHRCGLRRRRRPEPRRPRVSSSLPESSLPDRGGFR